MDRMTLKKTPMPLKSIGVMVPVWRVLPGLAHTERPAFYQA
jgi:hypothetical protein